MFVTVFKKKGVFKSFTEISFKENRSCGRVKWSRGRRGRRTSSGSSTYSPSLPRQCGEEQAMVKSSPHSLIPSSARLRTTGVTWTNQHGHQLPDREVIGDRVLIRQQPAQPPRQPQILILTDQMLEKFLNEDKYFKCLAMFGYTLADYTRDVKDELIDLNFPYIIIFLGSMQLGLFESLAVYKQVSELLKAINQVNSNSHVLITGLVPQPMDYPKSRKTCENYNSSYRAITHELRRKFNYNVGFKDVFLEFLTLDGRIVNPKDNFVDDIFLSVTGARRLRAVWLRHLGFFPKKAAEVMSNSSSDC